MWFLALQRKSFFTTAIGGGHGTDAGTDLFVMIEVGASSQESRVGMAGYLTIGETTIGIISGEATHGTIIISATTISIGTGEPGITPVIGISRNIDNSHTTTMEGSTRVMSTEGMFKATLIKGP